MPTYEYKCKQCGHKFEVFQSMTAELIKTCPKCKGEVKRLIGAGAGPIFKGSGFYQTDYKSKSGSASVKKEPSKSASAKNSSKKD